MAYAVFKTGGKQYRVQEGETLDVEKIDAEVGSEAKFEEVLLVNDGSNVTVGTPTVSGATVTAKVVDQGRGKKIKILKFKRRKHHMKTMGHRQDFTQIEITGIAASAPKKKVAKKAAAKKPAVKKVEAEAKSESE